MSSELYFDSYLTKILKYIIKELALFFRTFLNDLGGNPNVKNGNNETSLHSACQLTDNKSFSAMERRAHCVSLIIQWRGLLREPSGKEKINLAAQDQVGFSHEKIPI